MDDIGAYRLVRPVGRGGLGVVYQAIDRRSGNQVALKVLHRATFNTLAARRLSREFRALHSIRHPNIVRVLDAGFHEDAPFLAMELVLGLPLRSYLACTGPSHPTEPLGGDIRGTSMSPDGSGARRRSQSATRSSRGPIRSRQCEDHTHPASRSIDGVTAPESSHASIATDLGSGLPSPATPDRSLEIVEAGRQEGASGDSSFDRGTDGESSVEDWDSADTTDHGSPPLAWLQGLDEPDSLPPIPSRYRHTRAGSAHGKQREDERTRARQLSPALQRELNRPERLQRLRGTIEQLCDGLAFIHRRGLVHRDIKPSNILVEDGGRAKLVDFGLVKLAGSGNTTATGHVVGTYRYMSPEQASGAPVDSRSDLYALGGVLYDMLCSHPPFTQRRTLDLMEAIIREMPPDPREVNPGADELLSAVAMRLLEKQPSKRFQSAADVARILQTGHQP